MERMRMTVTKTMRRRTAMIQRFAAELSFVWCVFVCVCVCLCVCGSERALTNQRM